MYAVALVLKEFLSSVSFGSEVSATRTTFFPGNGLLLFGHLEFHVLSRKGVEFGRSSGLPWSELKRRGGEIIRLVANIVLWHRQEPDWWSAWDSREVGPPIPGFFLAGFPWVAASPCVSLSFWRATRLCGKSDGIITSINACSRWTQALSKVQARATAAQQKNVRFFRINEDRRPSVR